MIDNQNKQGFTLVELSVVIVIIGILLAAGLKLFNAQAESAAYSATQKKIDAVKVAISSYLRANRRLPCPDIGPGGVAPTALAPFDGIEDRKTAGDVTTQCTASIGVVPFVTLGIPQETAIDGWQNYLTYRVFYTDGVEQWDSTRTASFRTGNRATIQVNNRFPATSAATTPIVNNAIIVLISHGKNGLGAWTVKSTLNVAPAAASDELLNTQAGSYIRRDYSEVDGGFGQFDDIVDFLTMNDLIAPLIKDGSMQSPEARALQDAQEIKTKVLGYIAANNKNATFIGANAKCGAPLDLANAAAQNVTDPWGSGYYYGPAPLFTEITSLGQFKIGAAIITDPTAGLITILSAGPDGLPNTLDDGARVVITGTEILNYLGTTWIMSQCP